MSRKPKGQEQPSSSERWRTRVTSGGRVVLPSEIRTRLGLADGDAVEVTVDAGKVVLLPVAEVVRRLQDKYKRLVPANRSVVDELIADRRAEAKRDRAKRG